MHTPADSVVSLAPPIPGDSFLRTRIKDSVPDEFLRDAIRALLWAYGQANEVSRDAYDGPEAHDIAGHLRRAYFEGALRDIGLRHGAVVGAKLNVKRTAFYSEVRFGEIVITESSATMPGKFRRPANFRTGLARHSQTSFHFSGGNPQANTGNRAFYAILVWGHFQGRMSEVHLHPDFLEIVFPNEDCTEAEERIDLQEQLRHEIEVTENAPVERVEELNLTFTAKTGTEIDEEEGG